MDIAEYQQLYLQAAYHYFREKAEWPGLRQIEKKILPTHRDFKVVEIARSLTESRYRSLITYNSNFQAILTIEQISKLQEAEQDLANFIKTIRFIADKYICSNADQVEVSSKDIRLHLQLDDLAIRKIAVLLHTTPVFASMTGSVDNSEWNLLISGNAIYFDGIQSIDDYKKKLDELSKSYTAGQVAQNVGSTIKKIAQADPSDIKTIGVSALELSAGYYKNPLTQSQQSFWWARAATIAAFLFFLGSIAILIFRQPTNIAIFSAIGGTISAFIVATFYALYNSASRQAMAYKPQVDRAQNFIMANSACETMDEERKQRNREELIRWFVGQIEKVDPVQTSLSPTAK